MKKRLYFVTFANFLFSGLWIYSAEQNQLCKVYHHDVRADQKLSKSAIGLEIAKVVFYFNKEPYVQRLSEKRVKGQKKEMVFFFPLTVVKDGECEKKLQALHSSNHQWYEMKVEVIRHPTVSLRFTIIYNPQKVEITYDSFDSIGMYKGLVFTFYDKTLLEKIKEHGKPLIYTASASKKPGVIIDCGHGGDDTGTVGYGEDIKEKDITLQIGLKVATLLRCKGLDVTLTRSSDMFVPLDRRTQCLTNHPDQSIFISIHTNSSNNNKASGIETFCLSPLLFCRCFNTMDEYTAGLLDDISCTMYLKSNVLAHCLHHNVLGVAQKKNLYLHDRHVKHAVSQVLMGPIVPSALIELGFLSNKYEAAFLKDSEYQATLAYGIYLGIFEYFASLKSFS